MKFTEKYMMYTEKHVEVKDVSLYAKHGFGTPILSRKYSESHYPSELMSLKKEYLLTVHPIAHT